MWFLKRRCGNGCDDVDQDDGGGGGDRAQVTQVMGSTGASRRATRVTGNIWWKRWPENERREIWMRGKRHDDRHIMRIIISRSYLGNG